MTEQPPSQAEVEAWWQLFHSVSEQLGLPIDDEEEPCD
jgi:hypothetical protein